MIHKYIIKIEAAFDDNHPDTDPNLLKIISLPEDQLLEFFQAEIPDDGSLDEDGHSFKVVDVQVVKDEEESVESQTEHQTIGIKLGSGEQ